MADSYINDVFNFVRNNKDAQKFFKKFGGRVAWGFEYGFVYIHRRIVYSVRDSFKEDVVASLTKKENLLLRYPIISKENSFFSKKCKIIKRLFPIKRIPINNQLVIADSEILGLITLALKCTHHKSILLNFNLLRFCRLRGRLLTTGSFLYSINFKKSIIPFQRLWSMLLSENSGTTDEEFLINLNRLIDKYHYPRYCLSQANYISPETNELKDYPMSEEEKVKWFNIDEGGL